MKKIVLGIALLTSIGLFSFKADKMGTYKVDTQKSTLLWTGKKVTGEHKGTIPLSSDAFLVEDKK